MSGKTQAGDQWIPLQITVFTRWYNSQLKEVNENEINSIIDDLYTGVSLIQVVQHLTKKNAPRPWKKSPVRNIDMVLNCDLAIEMVEKDGIHLVGISGKDVNDKNEKLILGLIWSLILNYSINKSVNDSSNKNKKNALFQWANERVSNYSNVNKLEPYHLAMCALLDSYVPEMINYKNIDTNNIEKNVQLACDVMKNLQIPVYIYPEDIIKNNGKVDDKTLLTQLSAAKVVLEALKDKKVENKQDDNPISKHVEEKSIQPTIEKPQDKKIFSPDDPSGEDITSFLDDDSKDYVFFHSIGSLGFSILHGDENNCWGPGMESNHISKFDIGYDKYSIKYKCFQIHTCKDESQGKPPGQFMIFGYNTELNRWDTLVNYTGSTLHTDSTYNFDVYKEYQEIPYRVISFVSIDHYVLAYLKYYGELIDDYYIESSKYLAKLDYHIRKDITIDCPKQPNKVTDGIFQEAVKTYGPALNYLLDVGFTVELGTDSSYIDVWEYRRKSFFTQKKNNNVFIFFNFVHHELFPTAYVIRPDNSHGSMNSWLILGCQNNSDPGEILDHHEKVDLKNDDSYYTFTLNDIDPNKSFRIIRLVGLNGFLSFHCFDFYGKAVPARELENEEYNGPFSIPGKLDSMFIGETS